MNEPINETVQVYLEEVKGEFFLVIEAHSIHDKRVRLRLHSVVAVKTYQLMGKKLDKLKELTK